MNARTLSKYWAFAHIALRKTRDEPADIAGRMLFYGVILGVFTALWRAISESGLPFSGAPERMVWYLAITEWIVLSAPAIHLSIEEDVRRGDIAYRLVRPVSYVAAVLFEGIGQLSIRLPTVGVAGFGFAWLFTGTIPEPTALLKSMPFVFGAALLLLTAHLLIGLLAFWLDDTAPVYWVFQKLMFVLGGLMLPLNLYPRWVFELSQWTPFPSLLYGPASCVLGTGDTLNLGLMLVFWLVATLSFACLLFVRARRALELNGG